MASVVRNFLAINDPDPKEMTIVEHLEELRRRLVVCIVVLGTGLFLVGAGVGYMVFPRVVQFLVSQQGSIPTAQFLLTVGDYVSQFALVMLIFGAVFELPVVLTFLAMIGAVSSRFLRA